LKNKPFTPKTDVEPRSADQKRYDDYVHTPGKLSATVFKTHLPFNVNKGLAGFEIPDVLDESYYKLDFDVYLPSKKMNLQRPLVWTLQQKQELIYSILKEIYIPPITAVQHTEDDNKKIRILKIIDGKQRLTTVIAFYRGEFSIEHDGKQYHFDDLANQAKRLVENCFRFDVGYSYYDNPVTDEQLVSWFQMINFAGTPQDKEHMDKLNR